MRNRLIESAHIGILFHPGDKPFIENRIWLISMNKYIRIFLNKIFGSNPLMCTEI